jgi:hypothetical protein
VEKLSDYSRISYAAEYLGFLPNTLHNRGYAGNIAVIRQLSNGSRLSPRQSVVLMTLKQAVQQLEDPTGKKIDVEKRAIATAFEKVAAVDLENIYPLTAYRTAYEWSSISKQLLQRRGVK